MDDIKTLVKRSPQSEINAYVIPRPARSRKPDHTNTGIKDSNNTPIFVGDEVKGGQNSNQ